MTSQSAKVQLAQVASRQWGRVSWAQIRAIGIPRSTVTSWLKQGYLHRRLPGVYAVGHSAGSVEADLAAALLYAGPGAMLSHTTAAWWWRLLDDHAQVIHVSTPRRCRSQPRIKVHRRRACDRTMHRDVPVTALAQTLLDLAAQASVRNVRRALANADYAGILDAKAVEGQLGNGRPGSAKLRKALQAHQPGLARTKSHLEVLFVELCERARLPMPEINVRLGGWEVDALFRPQRVAVELDGYGNHHSPAQVKRDRRKELALRRLGCLAVRYSEEQLSYHPEEVIADVGRLLAA